MRASSRITKRPAKGIYQLGPEGVALLIREGYAPETLADQRLRANELKPLGRDHALHCASIVSRLLYETKGRPEKIAVLRQGSGLWDKTLRLDEKTGRPFPVRPDRYFVVEHTGRPEGKNRRHVFVEGDCGAISVVDAMARKIMGYLAYHDEQLFAKK